ncbi:MAG: hypothetical protein MZW92_28025 [Comamonadaceae bacterium]|nr:hypothetical protein [Comamonadaceae bacterium]
MAAHAVALTLAALGLLRLPEALVETAISRVGDAGGGQHPASAVPGHGSGGHRLRPRPVPRHRPRGRMMDLGAAR